MLTVVRNSMAPVKRFRVGGDPLLSARRATPAPFGPRLLHHAVYRCGVCGRQSVEFPLQRIRLGVWLADTGIGNLSLMELGCGFRLWSSANTLRPGNNRGWVLAGDLR